LFLAGDSALFLRRSGGGDHPNEWCFPGGQMEQGETAEAAAVRETWEEAGVRVDPKGLRPWTRTVAPAEAGTPAGPSVIRQDAGPADDHLKVWADTKQGELKPSDAISAPDPEKWDVHGDHPDHPRADAVAAEGEAVDFTTYCVRLKEQFTPTLDLSEHDGYAWAPVTAPPEPLHPGCRVALERLGWNELDVAEAMAAGRLTSPQKYENLWLFAIRITGTGIAYRHGRKEFVWRNPELYMNERFLKRINGLATIWEHPEKSLLNGKEFTKRAVGAVMLPYLRPDLNEVWAIARIHDEEAAKDMEENPMSTSPAVNFADPTENIRIPLDNGKMMLIEGDPSIIDHIAICPHGVWDKMGDPTGVESVNAEADAAPLVVPAAARNHNFNLLRAHAAALALKAQAYLVH
jgi:8-oxo-dGTP pyrophosphatase MutT (NUDIX family)